MADTISLKNGDHITGKIILIEENTVMIRTEFAGNLLIKSHHIERFKMNAPVSIKENRFTESMPATEIEFDRSKKGAENRLLIKSHGIPKSIPFDKELLVAKINGATLKAEEFRHSGNVDLSAYLDKDTSKTTRYRVRGNYKLEHGLWRHHIGVNYYRKRDNDRTKNHNYNINYAADRFFSRRFFWQGSVDYQHDWVEDIRENLLVGTGPGWQLWNNERSSFSMATLLNFQQLEYKTGESSNSPQATLKWDFQQYFFNQRFKFNTTGSVGRSFNADVALDLNLNATLAYKLTESLALKTGYNYEKLKAKRGDARNSTISIGVGYHW